MSSVSKQATQKEYLSEISPLKFSNLDIHCFQIAEEIEKEAGKRISYHLSESKTLSNILVVFDNGLFYALSKEGHPTPSDQEWSNAIEQILSQLPELGDFYWRFQRRDNFQITPQIKATLAVQAIRKNHLETHLVFSANNAEVRLRAKYWSETVELQNQESPAIALTIKSSFLFAGTLEAFYNLQINNPVIEEIIIGLEVKNSAFDNSGNGTIIGFRGTVGERRQELLIKPMAEKSRQALQKAPPNQPVVAVRFGKNKQEYHFAMAALIPCITQETASSFGVEWGSLIRQTKISPDKRQQRMREYKARVNEMLQNYGIQLQKSVNSRYNPAVFIFPSQPLEDVELLFGNNVVSRSGDILRGLRQGGVYQRHATYNSPARPIRISLFKVTDQSTFTIPSGKIQERLNSYKFKSEIVDKRKVDIANLADIQARVTVEEELKRLMVTPPDIVIVGLPTKDRSAEDDISLYNRIYSTLLRRQIASQFIYEDTLNKRDSFKYILDQIVPGILAKLGNLPFILKEPLSIADYYIGFDISRAAKEKLPGSMNACASVRIHGRRGDFIRYHLQDTLIAGEEIPRSTFETLLPAAELQNKIVLIYRDGRFVGKEVKNLLAWAKAINAKFILVESRKSQIPRLFNLGKETGFDGGSHSLKIMQPDRGLLLKLSDREGILVTTEVSDAVGLARPLRLSIHPAGYSATIEDVADVTLKLTLLHHGSLKQPRTPMPIFAADQMAYRRLQGIYPMNLQGDKQFWL